ncbi:MAG: hypothetical protein WD939_10640 [Dehalococcoidia bacterium]
MQTSSQVGGQPATPPEAPQRSAADAAEHLERTLAHFESMLETLEQRSQAAPESGAVAAPGELTSAQESLERIVARLEATLEQLGAEAERLSDSASDLAVVAGRLEVRMNEVVRSLSGGRPALEASQPAEPSPPAPAEPQFAPGEDAVGIVLAAVPGFQGLMDAQRALNGLPEADSASVVAYKNGEAAMHLVLREAVSARRIVEGLRSSTGHQLVIEESRPEALRLRLRFVDGA